MGYVVHAEYADRASGAGAHRPELDRMMADARKHYFDIILITKLDRMMRSTANTLNLIKQLEGYRIGLTCLDQDIDTKSPTGRLLLTVLAAIAEFERDLIISRVNDGIARAKAEGKHCGRPRVPDDKASKRTLQRRAKRGVVPSIYPIPSKTIDAKGFPFDAENGGTK
jgi:DNA invertase Pin-like site-specific DNA recombinase